MKDHLGNDTHKNELVKLSIDESTALIQMQDNLGKNSLSQAFVNQVEHAIQQASAHERVKVVLLKGLSDVFCAGASLKTLQDLSKGTIKPVDIHLSKMLLDIPVPVIAAMEGHAIGGGLALGLCADMAILAEESRYGCLFMNMGFTPGMGITKLMEHYMAPALAHELMYTGITKKGIELKAKTHINYIVPKAEVPLIAQNLCRAIAEKPRVSLVLLKRYLSLPRRKLFEETYSVESTMHDISFNQPNILTEVEKNYVR